MAKKIKSVEVENFKCFEELRVDMENLNVFTGINSMGKSTVIQALLLLRQSYLMKSLDKGVHLKGDLVEMGTGHDVFCRYSEGNRYIGISLSSETGSVSWKYEYDYSNDSDYLPVSSISYSPTEHIELEDFNLFNRSFSYIAADRIGPQRFYDSSYYEVIEENNIGKKGDYLAGYLAEYGNKIHIDNSLVLHENSESDLLINQTAAWLSEVSPGISLTPSEYKEVGIVNMGYSFYGEKYLPIGIGFGISYVAPIIVSLLKAQKGDLVIVENPEAHLHPKGQRKMGELIARAASGGVQVIVETHSDHLLNGIRLAVKNEVISTDDVRLNYFYAVEEKDFEMKGGNKKYIHTKSSPSILKNGKLSDWPDGFFDEWEKALEELL